MTKQNGPRRGLQPATAQDDALGRQRQNNRLKQPAQLRSVVAVYDGPARLGCVIESAIGHHAIAADGRGLGIYPSAKAAADALSANARPPLSAPPART